MVCLLAFMKLNIIFKSSNCLTYVPYESAINSKFFSRKYRSQLFHTIEDVCERFGYRHLLVHFFDSYRNNCSESILH